MSFFPLNDNGDALLSRIKAGDRAALGEVYKKYKKDFFQFASRYSTDNELLSDVYQDVIIAFHENTRKLDFSLKSSSLKTYLFSIGKYMIFNRLRNAQRSEEFDSESHIEEQGTEQIALDFLNDSASPDRELEAAFEQLGERCKEVLTLFYYGEKRIAEIKEILGYQHTDVVKSQKSRCLKSLKEFIKSKSVSRYE